MDDELDFKKLHRRLFGRDYHQFAILDEHHKVVPEEDILTWARWNANHHKDLHWLGKDYIDGLYVSTIFTGVNGSWAMARDLWFETMVFRVLDNGGIIKQLPPEPGDILPWRYQQHVYYRDQYETWDEAAEGHARVVAAVRKGEIGE